MNFADLCLVMDHGGSPSLRDHAPGSQPASAVLFGAAGNGKGGAAGIEDLGLDDGAADIAVGREQYWVSMNELASVWRNTRMVVLTAMCASIYAAILIPFVVIPLIPGVTHFRPANAVPVVCSFLFGPAAAWGAAFGNLIADFFTGIGPGSFFGFWGNFLYALVPYRLWMALSASDPVPQGLSGWVRFAFVILVASALCAATVGWGLELLGFVPFSVLANLILINNLVTSLVLAPFLLMVLYPRVRRGRLLWQDIVGQRQAVGGVRRVVGLLMLVLGTAAALYVGNLRSAGFAGMGALGADYSSVGVAVMPAIACAIIGLLLL